MENRKAVSQYDALHNTLSVVIPVYRSEKILPFLVQKSLEIAIKLGYVDKFELVLVNDCSPDNSWAVITALANEHSFIRGVCLRRNFGQHNAVMAGLHHATGRFVVIMDDDLQHPPEAIGEIVSALLGGFDVCYTNYVGRKHALWKVMGSRFNDRVASMLLNKPRGLYLSSFKGIRWEVAQEIIKYDGPYAYVDGLILDITRSITSVQIQHQPRHEGEGNYNLQRSISLWLKMATSFSVLPLRVATLTGFALSFVSALIILFILIEKLLKPDLPRGWASLIATVLFVGGIQTMCLGIIGEYIGRSYLKLNKKPQFVVASTTWSGRTLNE
jgi:glycosyltransferase involved in cell wall biosynthesis